METDLSFVLCAVIAHQPTASLLDTYIVLPSIWDFQVALLRSTKNHVILCAQSVYESSFGVKTRLNGTLVHLEPGAFES